jgi:glucosamine 6-phosphate synthetase-like amidotransferase/phosphosugar isomerase protein
LRAAGFDAVAEYASAATGWPPSSETLVVAISATGTSVETLAAVERYRGISPLVAITNRPGSAICEGAVTVPLLAGEELGGVACRSYQHTGLVLQALHNHLVCEDGADRELDGDRALVDLISRVGEATADLLDRRSDWFEPVESILSGGTGIWSMAPAERLSSAEQSALMLREGPRLVADACETGDWSHVDVYLTKTCDYRALLFPGSRWDAPAWQWLVQRRSKVVVVGGDVPDSAGGLETYSLRYIHDQNGGVRLYSETLVAELIAAHWWAQRTF